MDAFDGDSDLSDLSAPPTPGRPSTPRAGSPEASAEAQAASLEPAAPITTDSPRPASSRRATRRVAQATAAEISTPPKNEASSSNASSSLHAEATSITQSNDTPNTSRRASKRDRKVPAKLRSPSPSAERIAKSSPAPKSSTAASTSSDAADTPTTRLKVKLNVKPRSSADGTATGDSGSSRGVTPQPGTSGSSTAKVTLGTGGRKKKLAEELRDLAEDDDEHVGGAGGQDEAHSGDDFVPNAATGKDAAVQQTYGKRDRNARNKPAGRSRRAIVADDEDEDQADEGGAPRPPQRKRARISDSPAGRAAKSKARSARKTVNYSSDDDDEDEEMVDAASDEEDLPDAAAVDTGDEFEQDDAPSRRGKATRKGKSTAAHAPRKNGGRAATVGVKTLAGAGGGKKATAAASSGTAATSNSASSKTMSAEARMRASIDAAKDKSLKPPGVSSVSSTPKLNLQASAFRPNSATKLGAGGASTPTGAGRTGTAAATTAPSAASAAGSGVKRASSGGGAKPAFGKSMSGWDQLFGGISGLTTTPNKATPTTQPAGSKPSTPTTTAAAAASSSGSGIRPDPVLESASLADVQRLREHAAQQHLNTDECFDLLAHADIMLAFERSVYLEDRKLATRLRPAFWKAGSALQHRHQSQPGPQQHT